MVDEDYDYYGEDNLIRLIVDDGGYGDDYGECY